MIVTGVTAPAVGASFMGSTVTDTGAVAQAAGLAAVAVSHTL